jgi:hypothetical protein
MNKFFYKINKLYHHKELSNLLDNNTIDYEIYNVLAQWRLVSSKHAEAFISIRRKAVDYKYFERPITQAMLDENIIFYHKYNKQVRLEHNSYRYLIQDKLNKLYKFSLSRRMYYHLYYSPIEAFTFSNDGFTMGQRRFYTSFFSPPWEHRRNLKYHGYNPKWDVPSELYKNKLNYNYSTNGIKMQDTF